MTPTCNKAGAAGTLCQTCRYSPLNQRGQGVAGRLEPRLPRGGGCQSHAEKPLHSVTPSAR